ncbi:MAG TPA: pilus assembly protein FimT [Polaromonas sp.]|uniref:GspH/FimT family pseudopilin n=1 Tax=Polaromonas sp. UBA4122 TaxID=1947074 RepID=UPI000EDDF9C4|nr:GspH/FimT family pseudopilin [Polaromonas sp. UBA4122]HAL39753.1 pilus assembly protein FimT [Polaromonas sp.]
MECSAKNTTRGFTLIELMVTVAVLAVMASLAAPSFRELLAAQRVRTTAYNIVGDLVLARNEAVKRGESVTLTPVSAAWNNGWSVNVASSTEVLSGQGSVGSGVQFTTSPASITFDRNGQTSVSTVVRFGLSDGGTHKRCISLDPSGRPKSANMECPP